MSNSFKIKVEVSIPKGITIERACGEVKELSEFLKEELYFKFNGVPITTNGKSILEMVKSYTESRG